MRTSNAVAACLLLAALFAPGGRAAAEDAPQHVEIEARLDAEWASYRHAYEAGAFFGKFVRTRPLIQVQMQIRPLDPATPMTGLVVRLQGEKTDLRLPVDEVGLVTVPQLKAAYDEDAVLRLNRPKGLYQFNGRYSIRQRDDGAYPVSELREACGQLLDAQRDSGYRLRVWGKKCVGVKFVYPATAAAAAVDLRAPDGSLTAVAAVDGHPFEDDTMGLYKVVVVRFADWPADARALVRERALAIGPILQ